MNSLKKLQRYLNEIETEYLKNHWEMSRDEIHGAMMLIKRIRNYLDDEIKFRKENRKINILYIIAIILIGGIIFILNL